MKILQIAPQIPYPLNDGGKIGIWGISKHLADRNNEIHFAAYRKKTDYYVAMRELSQYSVPYILDVQTDNRTLPALLNLFSPIPYNVSKFITNTLKTFLKDFFSKNRVDIVHIDHLHLAWTIDIIRELTNVPVVLREHNLEMMIMKRYYETQNNTILKVFALVQYLKFKKYEPQMCQKFDMCVTVSDKDKELLLEMNPEIKATTISVGVDKKLFEYKRPSPKPFSIAHVGQLNWLPNLDSLQWFIDDILPKVVQYRQETALYIYGAGDYTQVRVPDELKGNIIFKGYVEDIWKEMEDKALLVVPLRVGSGIRVKILEMLAFGQPIITTSIGKEGLELNDMEHLLVADTKEEFADKIISFFERKFDIENMIKNSRIFIEQNYTWQKIAHDFEQLYLTLTSK